MRSIIFPIIGLLIIAVAPVHGQLPLNPLKWYELAIEKKNSPEQASVPSQSADKAFLEAKAKYEAGNRWSASRKLKQIVKKYPTTLAAADALALNATIYLEKGRFVKSFQNFQKVIDEHPTYPRFDNIIGLQFEASTALMEGARGKIFGLIPGFRQYNEAMKQFEQIVRNAPYSDYAPLALMNVAIIAQRQGKEEIAIDTLDRFINFYPQSMLASDAYFNLADAYADLVQGFQYDQGATRQAISYYEDFLILFPENQNVGEVEANIKRMENLLSASRKELGDFYYFHRSNTTAALAFYNEAITIAPDSESADDSRRLIDDINAGVRPTTGSSFLSRLLTGR